MQGEYERGFVLPLRIILPIVHTASDSHLLTRSSGGVSGGAVWTMKDRQILEHTELVTEAGLAGASETALVDGFCRRLVEYGVPLTRVAALIDTLHPVLEARTFHWHRMKNETKAIDYARSSARENEEKWLRSPFHYLSENDLRSLRCRIVDGDCPFDRFPVLSEFRDEGFTDYLAVHAPFGK